MFAQKRPETPTKFLMSFNLNKRKNVFVPKFLVQCVCQQKKCIRGKQKFSTPSILMFLCVVLLNSNIMVQFRRRKHTRKQLLQFVCERAEQKNPSKSRIVCSSKKFTHRFTKKKIEKAMEDIFSHAIISVHFVCSHGLLSPLSSEGDETSLCHPAVAPIKKAPL